MDKLKSYPVTVPYRFTRSFVVYRSVWLAAVVGTYNADIVDFQFMLSQSGFWLIGLDAYTEFKDAGAPVVYYSHWNPNVSAFHYIHTTGASAYLADLDSQTTYFAGGVNNLLALPANTPHNFEFKPIYIPGNRCTWQYQYVMSTIVPVGVFTGRWSGVISFGFREDPELFGYEIEKTEDLSSHG